MKYSFHSKFSELSLPGPSSDTDIVDEDDFNIRFQYFIKVNFKEETKSEISGKPVKHRKDPPVCKNIPWRIA